MITKVGRKLLKSNNPLNPIATNISKANRARAAYAENLAFQNKNFLSRQMTLINEMAALQGFKRNPEGILKSQQDTLLYSTPDVFLQSSPEKTRKLIDLYLAKKEGSVKTIESMMKEIS